MRHTARVPATGPLLGDGKEATFVNGFARRSTWPIAGIHDRPEWGVSQFYVAHRVAEDGKGLVRRYAVPRHRFGRLTCETPGTCVARTRPIELALDGSHSHLVLNCQVDDPQGGIRVQVELTDPHAAWPDEVHAAFSRFTLDSMARILTDDLEHVVLWGRGLPLWWAHTSLALRRGLNMSNIQKKRAVFPPRYSLRELTATLGAVLGHDAKVSVRLRFELAYSSIFAFRFSEIPAAALSKGLHDPKNERAYTCSSSGESFGVYNSYTLTAGQTRMARELWGDDPAHYACKQSGCEDSEAGECRAGHRSEIAVEPEPVEPDSKNEFAYSCSTGTSFGTWGERQRRPDPSRVRAPSVACGRWSARVVSQWQWRARVRRLLMGSTIPTSGRTAPQVRMTLTHSPVSSVA